MKKRAPRLAEKEPGLQYLGTGNMWMVASVWMVLAAISAVLAIRIKMAAALVEMIVLMQNVD